MRRDHAKVKKLAAEKRSLIKDNVFFTSPMFRGYMEDISAGLLKRAGHFRPNVKIRMMYDPTSDITAYTDGYSITINAGWSLITELTDRAERTDCAIGVDAHELGHYLYTNFVTLERCFGDMRKGRLNPEPVEIKTVQFKSNCMDLIEALQEPQKARLITNIVDNLQNRLEDGYVEERMYQLKPGIFGRGLTVLRNAMYERAPTIDVMIQNEAEERTKYLTVRELVLMYAKYGEFKYSNKEELSDERVLAVMDCAEYMDQYIMSRNSMTRMSNLYTCVILLWDYIKDYVDYLIENPDKEQQMSKSGDTGGAPKGTTSNTAEDSDKEPESGSPSSPAAKKRMKTKKVIKKDSKSKDEDTEKSEDAEEAKESKGKPKENSEDESDSEGSEGDKPEEQGADETGESDSDESGGNDSAESEGPEEIQCDSDPTSSDESPDDVQDVSEDEKGRLDFGDKSELEEPDEDDQLIEREDFDGSGYENAANDVERLLDKIAEHEAEVELECELERELNNFASSIDYGNAHKGIPVKVSRIAYVSDELRDKYSQIAGDINMIVNRAVRGIEQALKDFKSGGKNPNLFIGRRLDARAAYREDGRPFYNMKLPGGPPSTAFYVVLDESGSMGSSDRATYARMFGLIMRGICDKLDIPCAIYGHSTDGWSSTVRLFAYSDYESVDKNDKYRLMDVSARQSNRDGAALMYAFEKIKKRPEQTKVILLMCDGQPAADGYYGQAAEDDLKAIKAKMGKAGINLIVAAIGDDKESIQRIYGDSYMDITDIKKLPVQLPKKLLSFIKLVA